MLVHVGKKVSLLAHVALQEEGPFLDRRCGWIGFYISKNVQYAFSFLLHLSFSAVFKQLHHNVKSDFIFM